MGVFYETIPERTIKWCRQQRMFCVATAPLSGNGHVNVSPKGGPGGEAFDIIDERTFWYRDLTGSGSETISHLYEPGNGRVTIMFAAYEGPPQIIRLWGKGRAIERGTKEFDDFVKKHEIEVIPGTRSIIIVDIHQVGSSCGFSVPFYDFKEFRPVLEDHWKKKEKRYNEGKEDERLDRYWAFKNAWSMDGLPGMKRGLTTGKMEKVTPIKKMVGPLAPRNGSLRSTYDLQHVILIALLSFLFGIIAVAYGPRIGTQFGGDLTRLPASMASPRVS